MKKVAIVTIQINYLLSNYGSFFQHYALRLVLKRMSFNPFRASYPDEPVSTLAWKYRKLRRVVGELLRSIKKVRCCSSDFPNRLFKRDYKRLIGPLYEGGVADADVAIAGSDQVWSSDAPFVWLASFSCAKKRISYAASANWSYWQGVRGWRECVKRHSQSINAVSVREQVGVRVFLQMGVKGGDVKCVCDPTMLLTKSEYLALADRRSMFSKKTLFCYFVNEVIPLEKLKELAQMLKADLRVLGIQGAGCSVPSRYRIKCTPCQFLAAMRDSSYVVTNSYHGLLFSLYFERPFVALMQSGVGKNQNARQFEILSRLGLTDRSLGAEFKPEDGLHKFNEKISWGRIGVDMGKFRAESFAWLKSALISK